MTERSAAEILASLPASVLEGLSPESKESIVKGVLRDADRARTQAWAGMVVSALIVAGLVYLSLQYLEHGAPTQGAAIITVGSVSLVSAFLGIRFTSPARRTRIGRKRQ